ncbi:GNAT family N-acetyltransferase [Sporomusa sp. KB1]|jgi:N-acetylglutamate synthase-like GNAT family acetyltransferase|uniref:GNAT family N-acetyltransferase n=1 Tax=Sporomusa sp. KB1 TaxID=943346 RepID=UPI0011A9CFD6|nr:GNAT family N-acetyltransferase [Sporomusa sp. KB1]TWH45644.1 putative P-loop ATPase fused to an acetyltransferase [Sporomusa sp. KB1]
MCTEIVFATGEDEAELQALFTGYGMGLAGDIEEHVLVKSDNKVLAGAMLAQLDTNFFHLLVFAVNEAGRNTGIGSQLLQEMINNPEKYCQNSFDSNDSLYKVTTVAKGDAVRFYEKNGFVACDFSELAEPYDEQCLECPDKEDCKPVAMIIECHKYIV